MKNEKKKTSRKTLIIRILIVLLAVFAVYNLISLYTVPEMSAIAYQATKELVYDFEGIISRDEHTIDINMDDGGILEPAVVENQMVKRGTLMATYYDTDIDDATRNELNSINQKIAEIKATPSESSSEMSEHEIENSITRKTAELIGMASTRDVSQIKALKNDINTLINKKLTDDGDTSAATETLDDLMRQKREIEKNYDGDKTEYVAPVHGVFSSKLDGYEKLLSVEKSQKLTVTDYTNLIDKKNKSDDEDLAEIKIIDNFSWAISVLADEQTAKTFAVDDKVTLRFNGEEKETKATIKYISAISSGKYIITAVSDEYSDYAMTNRFAKVTFIKASYEGLLIPVSAIRVQEGKTGVYVKTDSTTTYKEVEVLYKDEKDAIVKIDNTKSNALLLYDEVVIS